VNKTRRMRTGMKVKIRGPHRPENRGG